MKFIIPILTFIFLLAAFLGTSSIRIANPFLAYVFYQVNFLLEFFLFFLVGFLFLIFFFIREQHADRRTPIERVFFVALTQTSAAFASSIFLALILLFAIACIELNIFAVIMNNNPKLLGVTTDTKNIVTLLNHSTTAPKIIASDKIPQKEVVAIATATVGTTNFYGDSILSAIPNFLIIPIKKTPSNVVYLDNVLIVTGISVKDMQQISPILGRLLVQTYFATRPIRSYPEVSVMDPQEFTAFQKSDTKTKLTKVTIELTKLTHSIATISATINQDKNAISANQDLQDNSMKKRDNEYNNCLSQGTYLNNVFQPKNTKTSCQSILYTWNTTLTKQASDEKNLNITLQKDQQLLTDYQYYDNFFSAQKKLLAASTINAPSELGVFEPPNIIKIVVTNKNSHTVADYIETLCHEYLHYASYTPGKRLDSSFFEEGLTEYFARQTVRDTLHIDTNIGYPVAVKIIEAMMQRIAEVDFADIYFTKDEVGLEHTLDLVYGDNFYKDTFVLFESLEYTSDPQQELELANKLMQKIGGQPLTIKDLYSTQSSF